MKHKASFLAVSGYKGLRVPEVLHISCNICTCDLPDMPFLSFLRCGPWASGMHIGQIPRAHFIAYTSTAVLEITVSHWPFSDQFQHLADQNLF